MMIAATYTGRYLASHPAGSSGAALTHGFQITFYVLAAVALLGAVISAVVVETKPALVDADVATADVVLEAAA
jgi:hypothetical protein